MTDSSEHRRSKDHWSVSKEVSIGNIVTTLSAIVTIVIFLITNRNDIDVNTNNIAELNQEKLLYVTQVQSEGDHNLLENKILNVISIVNTRMDGMNMRMDGVDTNTRNNKNATLRVENKVDKIKDILLEMQREKK